MPKHHSIEEAVFDISFDSMTVAHEQQGLLADFLQNRLLPLADEVFSEFSTEGMVSKIDKLEIDLGDINYSSFHNEMEGRFKEQLRSVLLEKIRTFSTSHSTTEGLISQKQEQANQLELFLETGRMSRNALQNSELSVDEILHLRIKHEGKSFLAFLKNTPHLDAVLKRLHKQFSESLLLETMQLISPQKAYVFEALLEESWKASQGNFNGISELEFKSLIREQLMYQLLKSDSNLLEPREIFAEISKAELSKHVQHVLGAERQLDTHGLSDVALLRTRVGAALIEGQSNSIVDIWEMLLSQHSSLLREVFILHMGDVIAQTKLADNFPETMLRDLVNVLLLPKEAQFITALAAQAELNPSKKPGTKNAYFWQHTIGYLHGLGAREYECLEYVASLFKHLMQQGLVQDELLKAIARVAPKIEKAELSEFVRKSQLASKVPAPKEVLTIPVTVSAGSGTDSEQALAANESSTSSAPDEAYSARVLEMPSVPEIELNSANIEANHQVHLEGSHDSEQVSLNSSLADVALLRTRVEAALIEGQSNSVVDIWEMLLSQHSSLLREVFILHMGDVNVQTKLAENFPETMLRDLVNVLLPKEAQFITALAAQAELNPSKKPGAKNAYFWQHTIGYLHGLGRREYERMDYVSNLISRMMEQGLVKVELFKAIARVSPEIDKAEVSEFVRKYQMPSEVQAALVSSEQALATNKPSTSSAPDAVHLSRVLEIPSVPEIERDSANIEANHLEQSEQVHDFEHVALNSSLADVALLRVSLEAALLEGQANGIVEIWGKLLSQHSSLVREVFMQRMGDVIAQTKLAENFPEAMLRDLMHVLLPNEAQFITVLAAQAELMQSKTSDTKNAYFWQHAISYLHALGVHEYERLDYVASLINHLMQKGLVQAKLLEAITRVNPEINKAALLELVRKVSDELEQAAQNSITPSTHRAEDLYQRLIQRLKNGSQEISMAQEIEELADYYPQTLSRCYQQLQTGDISADFSALNVHEIKQLIISFVRLRQGSPIDWEAFIPMGTTGGLKNVIRPQAISYGAVLDNTLAGIDSASSNAPEGAAILADFGQITSTGSGQVLASNSMSTISALDDTHIPREFETQAMQSLNEQRYYQFVLEKLLHNQKVNFKSTTPEIETVPSSVEANLIATIGESLAVKQVLENSALAQAALLRIRFEESFVFGRLDRLSEEWDELILNHGAMIRDVFLRRMEDERVREKLAQGFPESYLQDLIRVLMAREFGFITQLAKQLALSPNAYKDSHTAQGNDKASDQITLLSSKQVSDDKSSSKKNIPFWKYTFTYLHATALSGYDRRGYLRGLLAYFVTQGLSQIPVLNAISSVDAMTDKPLSENFYQHPHRMDAKDNGSFSPAMDARQRGDELHRHLIQRLSGAGQAQLDIAALAREYPETMQRFLKELQAGDIKARLEKLSEQESKQIIDLLLSKQSYTACVLNEQQDNVSSIFQAAIDAHAHKVHNKQLFYSYVLEKLIRKQIVDLEAAVAASQSPINPDSYEQNVVESVAENPQNVASLTAQSIANTSSQVQQREADSSHSSKLLRRHLEQAFIQGRVDGIVWDELVAHHTDMIREVFLSRMGQVNARNKLLKGFPQAMLHELISVLVPFECEYIETLSKQPELTRNEVATVNPVYFLFWEYTLAYLHASGLKGYERTKYTRGLQRLFSAPGFMPASIAQALQRTDLILNETGANRKIIPETEYLGDQISYGTTDANRSIELYQKLLDRLTGKNRIQECVQEIIELANTDFEAVTQLYGRLQSGGHSLDVSALTLQEAWQHIEIFISVHHGNLGGDFWREIEAHVAKSRNPHRYYQYILDSLLRNQIVDIEVAMGVDYEARDVSVESLDDTESGRGELLGLLLESALQQGKPDALSGLWDELRINYRELARDVFKRNINNKSTVNQIVKCFSETIILDAAKLLNPHESDFVATLSRMPELRVNGEGKSERLWSYTFAYLHTQGLSRFDKHEYLRGLIAYLEPDEKTQGYLSQALVQRNPELANLLSEPLQGAKSWKSESDAVAGSALATQGIANTDVINSELLALKNTGQADSVMSEQDFATYNLLQQANYYADEVSGEKFEVKPDRVSSSEPSVGASPAREVTPDSAIREQLGAPNSTQKSERSEELYTRLMLRLSGNNNGASNIAADIESLAREFPLRFKQLIQQLHAAPIFTGLSQLSMQEARQFVISIVGLNGDGAVNFHQSIADYAKQARDAQGFYLHVLGRLINEQLVDLEVAVQAKAGSTLSHDVAARSIEAAQPNAAQAHAEVLPAQAKLLEATFEKALVEADANEVSGVWLELMNEHSAMVIEVFLRRAGDVSVVNNLSKGFPETMLRDFLGVLVPRDSRYIEASFRQTELVLSTSDKRVDLWKHALSYLHSCALKGFEQSAYIRSLISYLRAQGLSRSELLQIVSAFAPELNQTLTQHSQAVVHDSSDASDQSDARDVVLYQHVLNRLTGNAQQEAIAHIEELLSASPTTLHHLYEQLQSGEVHYEISVLTAKEAKLLSRSFIELSQGPSASAFLLSIEANAQKADNERRYYQYILEKLLNKQNVDMEEALRDASAVSVKVANAPDASVSDNKIAVLEQPQRQSELNANPNLRSPQHDELEETGEEIYIANAGLMLVSPYLPKLFEMLKLTEDSKFIDEEMAERAIHLLQYVVNERCDSPEFLLVLNKLLCGVVSKIPIAREIVPLPHEIEAIEGMLKGIIANWSALGSTSVAGLRESFLQRAGRLQLKNDNWYLKVEPKAFDMLLDRLPWSIAIIKYSWMKRPIYVEWR